MLITEQILELRFDPLEPRDERGRWTRAGDVIEKIVEPIGMEGARGNSRAVSHAEFQRYAAEGRQRLRDVQAQPWSTQGLDQNWPEIKNRTWAEVQKSWGGATVDPRTGRDLPQGADKFAMSIKPHGLDTTSIPEHADRAEFDNAMNVAQAKYHNQLSKGGSYLGIFHDDDLNRIDIDPVTVVDSLHDVETIGAYTHAIGGAYRFSDGNGYWPPHVEEGASMSDQTVHWPGPGAWRSHADAVQQPHDEPEDEEGDDEEPLITAQILQFARWDGWMHERRDAHGRWVKGDAVEESFGKLLRAAATPFVGRAPQGEKYPGEFSDKIGTYWKGERDPDAKAALNRAGAEWDSGNTVGTARELRAAAAHTSNANDASRYNDLARDIETAGSSQAQLRAAVGTEAGKAKTIVPNLLSSPYEIYNGKVSIFSVASKPHVLAELDWDGSLSVQDQVAAALQEARAHPDQPVKFPDAFEVVEHEMIHGVVPPGTEDDNKRAYQDYATAQIEEGFTELGAIQHGPDFMDQMGIGDRQSVEWPGHTVKEQAVSMSRPSEIASGNSWGHYQQQTKDAQEWVQLIAREEGSDNPNRATELADEINRVGSAGKIGVMAYQMARTLTPEKMSHDQAFITDLTNTIAASIKDQWKAGEPGAAADQAFGAAKNVATQKVAEKEREMEEAA